jgi:hypothetical protein
MSLTANILAVGGGGGSSTAGFPGGGGGGQVVSATSQTLSLSSYNVTVGSGGGVSANGSSSTFGSIVTAVGGVTSSGNPGNGGASGSGNAGGSPGTNAGGGGGGNGTVGSGGSGSDNGGNGGNGTSNSTSGSAVIYGGGGGGSGFSSVGSGGTGGGGNAGIPGTPNTGGGAGSASTGGSGIIIVSIATSSIFPATISITGTGNTTTTSGSNTIYTFITSGTFTITYPTTRYWVSGTGNWDASTTTNWAYSTGGTGQNAPVPTSTNAVFFDGNSGGGIVTITATSNCINLTTTGFTGTITGSSALNIYGSMTLSSGITFSYSGALSFLSTTIGQTITTAGKTLPAVNFNGSGGAWTLQDNWTASSISLNTGSLTTNNVNISTVSFGTSGTLILGSSTITLTGTGVIWIGGGTLTSGTSTIVISDTSSSSKTFTGAGLTYYNLTFTGGTGVNIIQGSNTFNALGITTPPSTINFTAGTTQTVNAFNVTGTAGNLNILQSTSSGSTWYLASANQISIDYVSLQDSHAVFL